MKFPKLAALLTIAITVSATAPVFADCREIYRTEKDEGFLQKMSSDAQERIMYLTGIGGFFGTLTLVGMGVVTTGVGACAILFPVAASPVIASEGIAAIKNANLTRMIHLVNQSERYLRTGKTLRTPILTHLHRQLDRKISLDELAQGVMDANNDGSLCNNTLHFKYLKENIEAGHIKALVMPTESEADLKGK